MNIQKKAKLEKAIRSFLDKSFVNTGSQTAVHMTDAAEVVFDAIQGACYHTRRKIKREATEQSKPTESSP